MDTNKYTQALGQLDACRGAEDSRKLHNQMNGLFAYLQKNFPAPEVTPDILAEVDALLRLPVDKLELSTRAVPPDMSDDIYPIALLKLSLTVYRMPIDPGRMSNFDWFHQTYSPLLGLKVTPHPINPKTAEEAQDEIAASTGRSDLFNKES